MPSEVFISYARSSSTGAARALKDQLGRVAYLDESELEMGKAFPKPLFEALLASRVVVIFADETYFQRWYCLRELELALCPFLRSTGTVTADDVLEHVLVVLPSGVTPQTIDQQLSHLPPALRQGTWPRSDENEKQVQLVWRSLERSLPSLAERIHRHTGATKQDVLSELLERTAKPSPLPLDSGTIPLYPATFPESLWDDFIGRSDELARIHFALSTSRAASRTAALAGAIEGLGGLGKTRLALEYVHRYGPRHYPGGIFWVEADVSAEALRATFHGILIELQRSIHAERLHEVLGRPVPHTMQAFLEEGRDARQELAAALQAFGRDRSILYVVDNLPEGDGGRALETWCPAREHVALLLTSRRHLSETGGVQSLPIEELPPEAAVRLLTRHLPDRKALAAEEWQEIVEWVGRHPLALELLNQVMRRGSEATTHELLEMARAHTRAHPIGGAITEAFSISYDKLSDSAKAAARCIARLAPDPIPSAVADALGNDFQLTTSIQLLDRSFITRAPSRERGGSWVAMFGVMHRLLADDLRSRSPDPDIEWARVAIALERALVEAGTARDLTLTEACIPHGLAIVAAGRVHAAASDEVRARLTFAVSAGLSALGRYEDSLELLQASIDLCRKLVETKPDAHLPNLASSLINLSFLLSKLGRKEQSLLAAQEATAMCRGMAEVNPATDLPKLALVLNNLSVGLDALGRREEALHAVQEAVEIRRKLSEAQPDAFLSDLATSLINLSSSLKSVGRIEEGLEAAQEAVRMYRRLVAEKPAMALPDLAGALNNVSNSLGALGRSEEGLAAAREMVEIRRSLAEEWPAVHLPDLALSLFNLSIRLAGVGQREDGLRAAQEAVAVYRELAKARPEVILPELAGSLNTLSHSLARQGHLEDSLQVAREAVEIHRGLVEVRRDASLPNLAESLDALAISLSRLRRWEEGLQAAQEAVAIYRELAEARPDSYLQDLAGALTNLSHPLRELKRWEDGLQAAHEAVATYRKLAKARPEALLPSLAGALNNLAGALGTLGRWEEGLAAVQEAVDLHRRAAAERPDTFLPEFARSLANLGTLLGPLGRNDEAAQALQEAVEIRRKLVHGNPDAFLPDLALSLHNLSVFLGRLMRKEEGLRASQEAVDLYWKLAEATPDAFLPYLAESLRILSAFLRVLGRTQEGLRAVALAAEIQARLD